MLLTLYILACATFGTVSSYASFNESLSRSKMAVLSAAVYSDNAQLCINSKLTPARVTKQVTIDCDLFKDKCSAFVYVDDNNRAVGLAYRGSTSADQIIAQVGAAFEKQVAFAPGGKVSSYFNDAWQLTWDAGIKAALTAAVWENPDYDLWITGHSLGGSVAAMAASFIVSTKIAPAEKIHLYTFGEPRTGNKDYANAHDKLVPISFRVIHAHDIVAHIPPEFMGYRHHEAEARAEINRNIRGLQIFYPKGMAVGDSYKTCIAQESEDCSEGQIDLSGDDHAVYYGKELSTWGRDGCP